MKSDLCFKNAVQDDSDALNHLLQQSPMNGDIQLSYQRNPDFFAACDIEGDISQIMVAKDDKQVVGCFSHAQYQTYIDGSPHDMAYLGQLRSTPAYRNKIRYIKQGFEACRLVHQSSHANYAFTSIVSDNRIAKRLLGAGIKGLPQYKSLVDVSTLAIPVKSMQFPKGVRQATNDDLPEIIKFLNREYSRFQLAPKWNLEHFNSARTRGLSINDFLLLHKSDELIGCLAVWDQSEMKQYIIAGYAKKVKRWRFLNNLSAKLFGGIQLPPINQPIHYAFLSHFAVADDNSEVLCLLIKAAMTHAKQKNIDLLLLGLDSSRLLTSEVKKAYVHLEYKSTLFSVRWPNEKIAGHSIKPGKLFHPEIAIM